MFQDKTATAVNQVIDHLADKLHVPTEKLWEALLHGAKVQVWGALLSIVATAFLLTWTHRVCTKAWKNYEVIDGPSPLRILSLVLIVFCIVFTIGTFIDVQSAISAQIAPDYWALNKLLDVMKSK